MTDIWIHTASEDVCKGTFTELGHLFYLQKKFGFTFNIKNLSTPIRLTIPESAFAGLGHCMFLSQSWAPLFYLEKPNWLSE